MTSYLESNDQLQSYSFGIKFNDIVVFSLYFLREKKQLNYDEIASTVDLLKQGATT